ncbi:MAG: class I SAM-dependent methyltransferase, partial [Kiloniellales bacterium]
MAVKRCRAVASNGDLAVFGPFGDDETFCIVALACGDGLLAEALLTNFPQAAYLGLDRSASVREATVSRLSGATRRAEVAAFDIGTSGLASRVAGADLVVFSLCIHHLDGPGEV